LGSMCPVQMTRDYKLIVSVGKTETSIIRDIHREAVLFEDDGIHRVCAVNCNHLQTVLVKPTRFIYLHQWWSSPTSTAIRLNGGEHHTLIP